MARNMGCSYGHEIAVDNNSKTFEKIVGEGISSFGTGCEELNKDMQSVLTSGSGLYPFGSGILTMGGGTMPFGSGFFSKLQGLAKKASSVIRGAIPAQLRRSAMDYSKKKARELLPQVVAKVKEEIKKEAPGLVARLTTPLLKKVPDQFEGPVEGYVKKGTEKGLSLIDRGLDMAQSRAMKELGGGRMTGYGIKNRGDVVDQLIPLPVATSDPVEFNNRQLAFMKQKGMELQRQRDAGNVPKRLILDHHSRNLIDQIMADKGYEKAVHQDMREQLGLMGRPSSTEHMNPLGSRLSAVAPRRAPKKQAGRPKGSATRGKGIVNL